MIDRQHDRVRHLGRVVQDAATAGAALDDVEVVLAHDVEIDVGFRSATVPRLTASGFQP